MDAAQFDYNKFKCIWLTAHLYQSLGLTMESTKLLQVLYASIKNRIDRL